MLANSGAWTGKVMPAPQTAGALFARRGCPQWLRPGSVCDRLGGGGGGAIAVGDFGQHGATRRIAHGEPTHSPPIKASVASNE